MKLRLALAGAFLIAFGSCVMTPIAAQTIGGCGAAKPTKAESTNRDALVKKRACFKAAGDSATATVTALDALIAKLAPAPSPTATPSPAPSPAPSPTAGGELDKVGSGINVADFLGATWGDGSIPAKEEDVGAFRFLCAPGQLNWDDAIVYPGQPGKSPHLHQWFGNTLANGNSTYASLRTTGNSTCNNMLNRSAYWVPAMMNGAGKVVQPDWLAVYYKRMPASDPRCKTAATACVKLPRGLRYIFGYNMLDPTSTPITDASKYQRWWNCDGPSAGAGHYGSLTDAVAHCDLGKDRLGMVLVAPNCWNGKDLDSPDHRSHMAYMNYDQGDGIARCPKTHPFIIPQFTLGAWYTTDATTAKWYLSSDRMPGMPPAEPGTTEHADWFGAWEDSILDLWTANCIDRQLSCNAGDLGNGQQMKTLFGYDYPAGRPLLDPPAKP